MFSSELFNGDIKVYSTVNRGFTPEEIAELNSSFSKKTVKFSLDDLTDVRTSQPAAVAGGAAQRVVAVVEVVDAEGHDPDGARAQDRIDIPRNRCRIGDLRHEQGIALSLEGGEVGGMDGADATGTELGEA